MEDLDCQSCGACCVVAGEVAVYHEEMVPKHYTRSVRNRMGFAAWEADFMRAMARKPDGACAALRGKTGALCSCAIYDRRPKMCREFLPGSAECREARATLIAQDNGGE